MEFDVILEILKDSAQWTLRPLPGGAYWECSKCGGLVEDQPESLVSDHWAEHAAAEIHAALHTEWGTLGSYGPVEVFRNEELARKSVVQRDLDNPELVYRRVTPWYGAE